MDMKISIITVTYNSAKFVKETLSALVSQEEYLYEYYIVDGGSEDSTLEIIKEFQPLFDGKLSYVSEPDKGIYDAMNKGIAHCSGEYIGMINSDDMYTEDALKNLYECVMKQECKPDVVYSDMYTVDEDGAIVGKIVGDASKLKRGMLVNHPTCFVRKESYEKHGTYDIKYRIAADYELMLRLKHSGCTFEKCSEPLAKYRTGGTSFNQWNSVKEKYEIQRKYYNALWCNYIKLRGWYRCNLKSK